MKFFIYSLVIALLGYFLAGFTPWWSITLVAGVIGAIAGLSGIRAFFMGFLGAALLWGMLAFMLNSQNDGILASRVGQLFGGSSPITLILITTILGGFIGGMGALTGQLAGALFKPASR